MMNFRLSQKVKGMAFLIVESNDIKNPSDVNQMDSNPDVIPRDDLTKHQISA